MESRENRRAFVRKLFVASQMVWAGDLLSSRVLSAEAEPAPAEALKFLVFGDWGRRGETDQTEVAAQMAITAKAQPARFIISVGDNFYEDGVTDVKDPQWQTSFEKVYADPALQVPWHVILGNHDYRGNCDAQIAYSRTSPRWHLPARYYRQTHRLDATTTADFFYLDTTPMLAEYALEDQMQAEIKSQDVPRQIEWFKNALTTSTAQWKIVFGHHPIFSGGEHGDTPELIKNILPILMENHVPVYFNGHDHDLQHLVCNDLNLICTGAGSQVRSTEPTQYTQFAKADSGFTAIELTPARMLVRMIDHTGKVLYTTCIHRPA